MPLRKQTVEVPFGFEGIDTKTDSKYVVPTKLTGLTNGVMTKPGAIVKRNGYNALSTSLIPTGSVSGGEKLGTFKDELLLFNQNTVYSRSEALDGYLDRGQVTPIQFSTKAVIKNTYAQSEPDMAINQNIAVYAWNDSRGGVRASVVDFINGVQYISDTSIDSTATSLYPRVVAMGGYIYVFYISTTSTSIKYRRLSLSDPTTFASAQTFPSSNISTTTFLFDIANFSTNQAAYCYAKNGGGLVFGIFDGYLATPSVTEDTATITDTVANALNICVDPDTTNFAMSWHSVATGIRCSVKSTDLTNVLAPTTVETLAAPNIASITASFVDSTNLRIFYEFPALTSRTFAPGDVTTGADSITISSHRLIPGQKVRVSTTTTLPAPLVAATDYFVIVTDANTIKLATTLVNALAGTVIDITTQGTGTHTITAQDVYNMEAKIRYNTLTTAGVAGTAADLQLGMGIASKSFTYNSNTYLVGVYDSTLQPTFFVLKHDGSIIGKIQPNVAGGKVTNAFLPCLVSTSSGVYQWPTTAKLAVETSNNMYLGRNGILLTEINFATTNRYFNREMGQSLLISGGFLSSYDGNKISEHGFHLYPEKILIGGYAAGGSLGNGTYQYAVLYEWTDAQGQRHQSAASPIVSVATGGASGLVRLVIESLRATNKKSPLTDVVIQIYRTAVGGSVFYRLTSLSAPTYNTTTDNYVTYSDTAADSSITSNDTLYLSAGVVDTIAPPAPYLIATNKTRAFLIPSESRKEIWFTKEYNGQDAVAFSDVFVKQIDPSGGDATALATMDEKVVFWKAERIGYFSGDGPLDTGDQDTFIEPQTITTDVGCSDPNSITLSSQGLFFKANKGIHLLNRNLDVEYIGKDVEAYNGYSVKSAQLVPNTNQVRFTLDNGGPALVYDYFQKQWQVFSNHTALDAIVWNSKYTYLRSSSGEVYQEVSGFYKDNNLEIPLIVETAWIKVAGLQSVQRVWRALLLGKFLSDHQLKISIAYDYEEFYTDVIYWNAGAIFESEEFGDGASFGDDDTFGGDSEAVYQVRIQMPRQKMESVRFKFEDVASGDVQSSMELSHLQLECGVTRNAWKLKSEKTVG